MKKLLALLLALTMVMAMAACGQDEPAPSTAPSEETTAPSEPATVPSDAVTEPSGETTAPSEPATAPSDAVTEPSGETTAPSEPATAPSDAATEPSEETTVPTEESTAPSEPVEGLLSKDSYSVSDADALAAHDKIVASLDGATLTNGELQIYYWQNAYDFLNQYSYYAIYMGLDYTKPFDQQDCSEIDGTWQHFFLGDALSGWHNYQSLALLAHAEDMELSPELQQELDGMQDTLAEFAEKEGYASVDAMLQRDFGPGCTYEDYYNYMLTYYLGYTYFSARYEEAAAAVTDADLEAWFAENQESLADRGITKDSGNNCNVRHILVTVAEGKSDADWENCRIAAQALLDQWRAGEATEDSFAAMAAEHSEDPGSAENGGLYTGLNADTNFVEPFKEWYMDESRLVGDYGLVRTDYGYHIMYFSATEAQWLAAAREGVLAEVSESIINAALEQYPMEVSYGDIALGVVDLSGE